MQGVLDGARRARMPLLIGFDVVAWVTSFLAISALEQLFDDPTIPSVAFGVTDGILCGIAFVLVGAVFRLHQGRSALGSFEDALQVLFVAFVVAVVNAIGIWIYDVSGKGILITAGPLLALLVMILARGAYRFVQEQAYGPLSRRGSERALIIGAGAAGRQLVQAISLHPAPPWRPVGLIDDDPAKKHRRIRGIRMMGRTDAIAAAADDAQATVAIIAIPSADTETIRRITRECRAADLDVKVMPTVDEMVATGGVAISDIRDIEVTDLLGRHVIDTDVTSIASYLRGKRVLVTGAGGSIGSELCRQINQFDPGELIMLDRDESALHAVELSLTGRGLLDDDRTVLGDIRDVAFVDDLFATRRPEVVFHAAALKHLPLLEKAPSEAIKTNVWGTLNILEAARTYGVERFVNISTDKAANPCSVLGYSKRLAEGLTTAIAAESSGTFLSVRFGNVLGSRGSVLTAFAKQIADGGPITVTDKNVTRYFMTIAEAVQLVIQAAAIGRDGEALVLDMGEPVSIDAVARQLIELSGKRVGIVYTGLRPGEKMHEELFADGEPDERPVHELISHTPVPMFTAEEARALTAVGAVPEVTRQLSTACLMLHAKLTVSML